MLVLSLINLLFLLSDMEAIPHARYYSWIAIPGYITIVSQVMIIPVNLRG